MKVVFLPDYWQIRLRFVSDRPKMLKKPPISLLSLLVLLISTSAAVAGQVQTPSDLPRVLVIATGGTIAGEQGEPGTLGGYEIRKPVAEIVAQVPELKRYAQVET